VLSSPSRGPNGGGELENHDYDYRDKYLQNIRDGMYTFQEIVEHEIERWKSGWIFIHGTRMLQKDFEKI
jgi:hypothetical protein